MKDRKYDKRHVRSKNDSGCLETLCHVRGPLRNKMATLVVIPSRSDSDPSGGSRGGGGGGGGLGGVATPPFRIMNNINIH